MLRCVQVLIIRLGGPARAGRIYLATDMPAPRLADTRRSTHGRSGGHGVFSQVSFDDLTGSLLVCLALQQPMSLLLPDRVAGPGGWFIDTGPKEDA